MHKHVDPRLVKSRRLRTGISGTPPCCLIPTNQKRVTHPADFLPRFSLATDDYSDAKLVTLKIPAVIQSKSFYLTEALGFLGHAKNTPTSL